MPVVVAALHSQLPAVAAAFKAARARRAPRVRDDRRRRAADGAVRPRRHALRDGARRRHRHVRARVRRRLRGGLDLLRARGGAPRRTRRRRRRRDGTGHRRHQHPARVQRHGGRSDPRRRARARRGGHRLPADVVRRRARPSRRAVAPQRHRTAPGHPRARAGRGAGARRPSRPSACATTSWPRGSTGATTWSTSTPPTCWSSSPGSACAITSMGRPAAADPALFQAAAAGGRRSRPHADGLDGVADRLERLVNLTATLLDTRRPLTLDELSERVEPRYPEEQGRPAPAVRARQGDAARARHARSRVETVDGFGAEQAYRIHPDDYYLPELALTEPELAALHVAVTAVRLEGDAGREGLAKLGGLAGEGADTALAELDVSPGLAVLFDAVSRRATVTFSYRGERAPPRSLRRRAPLRPLVRRRPRPRPGRPPRLPGRPHRRRARAGTRRGLRAARRGRPGRVRPRRPAHLRRGPARRRARAGRRPARRLGGRPARRGGGAWIAGPTARSSSPSRS